MAPPLCEVLTRIRFVVGLCIFGAVLTVELTASRGRAMGEVPAVVVTTDSDCPTVAQVEAEVMRFARPPRRGADAYRFEVVSRRDGVHVARLVDPSGNPAFTRQIRSDDCQAVAAALGLILRAHFVEVGFDVASAAPPEPSTPPEPVAPEPESRELTPQTDAEEGASTSEASIKPRPMKESASAGPPWRFSIRGAAVGQLNVPGARAQAGADLGGIAARRSIRVHADVLGSLPTESGEYPNRVTVLPVGLVGSVGWRSRSRFWWEPRGGGGARVVFARALDVQDSGRVTSISPVLVGAMTFGADRQTVRGWAELFGVLELDRKEYVIEPRGVVGVGPRAELGLALGFEFDPFSK